MMYAESFIDILVDSYGSLVRGDPMSRDEAMELAATARTYFASNLGVRESHLSSGALPCHVHPRNYRVVRPPHKCAAHRGEETGIPEDYGYSRPRMLHDLYELANSLSPA